MADLTVISVLAFLHIVSAVAWLGGVVFFLSAVSPGMAAFTPAARLEYLTKIGPKQIRFFAGASTATIIFGLLLLYSFFGSDYTEWPLSIEIGFGLGLIAYLVAIGVTIPTFRKMEKIAREMLANPQSGPPPPEFARLGDRSNLAAMTVAALLILTAIFMVVTAFPY